MCVLPLQHVPFYIGFLFASYIFKLQLFHLRSKIMQIRLQLFSLFLPYRIIFASPIITCLYSYYAICFVSSFGLCPDSCFDYGMSYDGGGRLPLPSFSSLSPRALSFVSLHVLARAATSSRIHLSVKYINFKFHKIVCHSAITYLL